MKIQFNDKDLDLDLPFEEYFRKYIKGFRPSDETTNLLLFWIANNLQAKEKMINEISVH